MKLKIDDDLVLSGLLSVTQGYNRLSNFVPRTDALFSDLDLDEYDVNKLKDRVRSSISVLDESGVEIASFAVKELESVTKQIDNECRVSLIFS